MVKFRTELMTSRKAKTLKEVIRKLIPSKGVKRKGNDEGIELLDCEEEEIPLEELEQECDDELCDDDEVENDNVVAEENHDQIGLVTISSASKKETSLLSFISDPEIKKMANSSTNSNKLWKIVVHPNCLSHTCHSFGQHFRKLDAALKNESKQKRQQILNLVRKIT